MIVGLLPKQMRYQAALLPDTVRRLTTGPGRTRSEWWARQDSNPRPSRYERPALTAELQAPRVAPDARVAASFRFGAVSPRARSRQAQLIA